MPSRRNEYRCTVEINQNGKYCVRIRAQFGRHRWTVAAYFLASSFDRAMKRLEQVLQLLQQQEEKLWFWCAERSDDPELTREMLKEIGLELDLRSETPRKSASIVIAPERPVPAFQLAALRRTLADSFTEARAAVASD